MLHVGVGRRNAQNVGSGSGASLIKALNSAAWYRYGIGITLATGVSAWADQSGNGRNLAQASAGLQPLLQADNSILFDGADDFLVTGAFTLNQPCTYYLLFKQVTWTSTDQIFNGVGATVAMTQAISSPTLRMNAGTGAPDNAGLPVDTYGVLVCVFNGASSLSQVNNGAPVIGNSGANNPGGFSLGASSGGVTPSNIQAKEGILYPGAHDANTRRGVINYLGQVGNISV